MARLTKSQKDILRKAWKRPDNRIVGGSPADKIALANAGYVRSIGLRDVYEQYELSQEGIDEITRIVARDKIEVDKPIKENLKGDSKAEILDKIVHVITNPEICTKTFELPGGLRVRFDRSGPAKLVLQILRKES